MKLAIMQPYVFPYLGYFQLINSVDKFVFYDDVTYIKQGWINRNNILSSNGPLLFTIPLENASSFKNISETKVHDRLYKKWHSKFLKTINQNYRKAPFFQVGQNLLEEVFDVEDAYIKDIAVQGITKICDYVGLETQFVNSSVIYNNDHLNGAERVLDICKIEKAVQYVNPIGGEKLYSKEEFAEHNIDLKFIQSDAVFYNQFDSANFIPNLSMIDVLMFNSPEQILTLLTKYNLK